MKKNKKTQNKNKCLYCKGKAKILLPNFCDPCYITIPKHMEFSNKYSGVLVCKYCKGTGINNNK